MSGPIGDRLDGLGVTASIRDTDLVTDAVVVLKVLDESGGVRLSIAWSDGMSWIERLGMLHAAELIERPGPSDATEPDD